MTTGLQLSWDTTPHSRRRQGGEVGNALPNSLECNLEVVIGCGERQAQVPGPSRPEGGAGEDRHAVLLEQASCELLGGKPRTLLDLADIGKRVERTSR